MRTVAFAVIAVAALSLAPRAQEAGAYAIRGARIVTVSGTPIEGGTVVIRNGVIDAVGASVAVPPDATIVEGSGLSVYPGLIDLGNTAASETLSTPPVQNPRTTAQVERWKRQQLLRPQTRAADLFKIDDADMTRLASAGVTTVLAVPPGDVISGQSALVSVVAPPDAPQIGNIPGPRRPLAVIKTPIALHVSFPARPRAGTNAYPVSLMGVIAFVRQAFLDGQHHALLIARRQPGPDDPALDALGPALARSMPVAFEANDAREILRALDMAREINLDPIITGAREASSVAGALKAQGARVVYSLNFPQRSRALAPDADEPLRTIAARADASKDAAALAKAGVPFAFASAGLTDARTFVRNAARTSSDGLGPDATLRALTLGAAEIAGVGQKLGSIDRGKAANLVVTDGDLFNERTNVVRVFVDGRPVRLDRTGSDESSRSQGR